MTSALSRWTAPNLLSGLRLALVPALVALAALGAAGAFLCAFALALATDAADGFLARRLGQASEWGARLDSRADLALWLALLPCAVLLVPDALAAEWPVVALLLASLVLPVALGWLKFGRLTSYHTWGAKASAWAVGVAALALFAGGPAWPLRAAAALVALSALEEIAITALLPAWRRDVPSLAHARRALRPGAPISPGSPGPARAPRSARG
jgi:CDP-diacylglycerol--glycerol-3-phosphate 3-phosphatidyltransferase